LSFSSLGERISIGVKARVLYSRLLSDEDYIELLCSESVAEVVEKLRLTAYEDALSSISSGSHRHEIEEAVKSSLIGQAERFMVHLGHPRDRLFKAWFSGYEAENLKSIFRYIMAGRESRDDLRRRLYPIKATKISFEKVLLAKGFAEASDALRDTGFYRVLREPLRRLASGEERSLFPLEMALDVAVESNMFKALGRFDQVERGALLPIFGTRVDSYNIYTLYRAMTYYSLTPEEILNRLLPVRYRISLVTLRDAVRMKSFEAALETISARFPIYSKLLASASGGEENELAIERNFKRYVYFHARSVFNSGSPDFHTAMAYFILRNFEIGDITRVIESVRYEYDRHKAALYLVTPVVAGGESEWQY
jgi:V/A-type H+-transporting ATPase subunit C